MTPDSRQQPRESKREESVMDRDWLRELRGDRTFRELGGDEYGTGYLSLLEQGKRTPIVTNVPKLAAIYGIDPLVMAGRFMQEAT